MYGLKATTRGRLTARQIEAARRAWTATSIAAARLDPHLPRQADFEKPAEVAWATARCSPEYFVAEIVPGKVLYEMTASRKRVRAEAFSRSRPPSCRCALRSCSALIG